MFKRLFNKLFNKKVEPAAVEPAADEKIFERPSGFRDLTKPEFQHIMTTARCPYCNSELLVGPEGGASLNVYCENVDECNSAFNVSASPLIAAGQFLGEPPKEFQKQHGKGRGHD